MSDATGQDFASWMRERIESGPLQAEEVVAALVPLMRQVAAIHEQGRVAPLEGLRQLRVGGGSIFFAAADAQEPRSAALEIARIERRDLGAVEIEQRTLIDTTGALPEHRTRSLRSADEGIVEPAFVRGYLAWEHVVAHHDALTDIFSLGLLLASLALGLDLAEEEQLERFVCSRQNPFALNPRLHPVLGRCLVRMADPRRARRAQDLSSLIGMLANHRDQAAAAMPLDAAPAASATPRSRRQLIQERLRDRLFDCSRRNRLLHYRQTLAHCSLTVASVPTQLAIEAIRTDDLCTWRGAFAEAVLSGKPVNLGRWLRVEDAPYLPAMLERIRADERRDKMEYGSSQLRLVVAFLRWHDLKEDKATRITSPLLMLPVALERRKGVRDAWTLTAATTTAEVNPALRHRLRQLYGLDLPETVDLAETSVDDLHQRLQTIVQASEPGVGIRLIDRPRIDLVVQRARARADHHRRKARLTGRGVRRSEDIDYSYDRDNFQPLGLQLFLRRVKPSPIALATVAGDQARERPLFMVAEEGEVGEKSEKGDEAIRTREIYVLKDQTEGNPYAWDIDICNLTLGNFNYRKMSLVRDYRTLLERDSAHPGFDGVFADTARSPATADAPPEAEALRPVVLSDPTQDAAVARAHAVVSYVIQGPPGTGKSQTITNLIADQVARGKRVLFVCAKRAALDVVHHRLAQRGLDRLCCLIHDTQDDKKPFIADLRTQYEDWLARPPAAKAARHERARVLADIGSASEPLQRFAEAMLRVDERHGVSVRALIALVVEASGPEAEAEADAHAAGKSALPGYADWRRFAPAVEALSATLTRAGAPAGLPSIGLCHVRRELFASMDQTRTITQRLDAARTACARATAEIERTGLTALLAAAPIGDFAELVEEAGRLIVLAERDLLCLLDRTDPANEELRAAVRGRADLARAAEEAATRTAHWSDPVPTGDCGELLAQVRACETSPLRILMPSWWRVRSLLKARYRFAAHVVPPRWSAIVADLVARYAAQDALKAADRGILARWKVEDLRVLIDALSALHDAKPSAQARQLREQVRAGAAGATALAGLYAAGAVLKEVSVSALALFGESRAGLPLADARHLLDEVTRAVPLLAHASAALRELSAAPAQLWELVARLPLPPRRLEAVVLRHALEQIERSDPHLPALDGGVLAAAATRLRERHHELLDLNARAILAEAHARFFERAQRSAQPAAPNAAERDWRRSYARGRRELEHEFGKVMRHRSIRDLAENDTGLVVADLKPVWLMSPLSVSDALPLDGGGFDVVIYDEASQIPIEEAIPALYRAPQAIVVGDRQQLPPTDFFASSGADDDADEATGPGQRFAIEHDSFLSQAAANLPGVMLGWHYRSRSESLIAFSNAAFYDGRLLTIPDVGLPHAGAAIAAIAIDAPERGLERARALLDRPVSYHRLERSPYEQRRNTGEARYIAHLLQGLLAEKRGLSIGVVAFSEAQQGEIEAAVSALTQTDAGFREHYEAELQREEDGQFCGLFIKNLENVQGDERDIIILSVCYGPDPSGRMLMNFGPINQSGGEKRLNVVFSRARRHMAVVTSIDAEHITNDFNDGAHTLKRYLAFAAAHSRGDHALARRVLSSISDAAPDAGGGASDPVARAIQAALHARGHQVATDVGGSRLRCDLAVRVGTERAYRLGIIIDHEHAYHRQSVWEREVVRPTALERFGWRLVRVRARDWQRTPEVVLDELNRHLAGAEAQPPAGP